MRKKLLFLIFVVFSSIKIFSANITVDELKIIADTHYNIDSQSMENNTYFKFITSFNGGYKFAAKIAFEANTTELEKSYRDATSDFYNKVFMLFKSAEVTAKNLIDSHLDISFWTGTYRYLGSGNQYRGYLYYPESTDKDFCGLYRMRGTGITTDIKFWKERFKASVHFYQNTNFISDKEPNAFYYFSADTEIGLYFKEIPVENEIFNLSVVLFGGITFPIPNHIQRSKAGLSFSVGNQYIDFFISAGVPKIDETGFTFHDIFLATDLHFKLAITDNTLSFLTRPLYFNEKPYKENGVDFDINYRLNIAIPDTPLNTGFICNFQYHPSSISNEDTWHLYLNGFLDILYSGVKWTISGHYDFSRIYFGNLAGKDTRRYLQGLGIIVAASSSF